MDLDGPLLDVSERYKTLHQDLLCDFDSIPIPPDIYWERKRERVPESAILEEFGMETLDVPYNRRRLELIETDRYLALDHLWPWTIHTLSAIMTSHTLVLITLRAKRDALERQLVRLGLQEFFEAILSEPATQPEALIKVRLIRDYLSQRRASSTGHWVIGDTEADIRAGQVLGMTTVAVCCGIRNDEQLTRLNPTYLINDIRELLRLIGIPENI